MSRSERLLQLVQIMRRLRRPVTARILAEELGISVRSVYRDIGTLVAQGFQISGEAGFGYVLKPGSLLPPMMFTDDELEAVILGLRWVMQRGDASLVASAQNVRAKIDAVLPVGQQNRSEHVPLLAGPGPALMQSVAVREALKKEQKLRIAYVDANGVSSARVIWPIALAFFDSAQVLVSWCESRNDFRSFRLDRLEVADVLDPYPKRRRLLLAEWRERERIPEQL